jgi:hypothetical protein
MRVRQRSRCRYLPLSQKLPTNAVDTSRQSGRCYIITSDVTGQGAEHPGRGSCSYEVVPVEHQTWLAPRAVCAGGPVCAVVRAFHSGAALATPVLQSGPAQSESSLPSAVPAPDAVAQSAAQQPASDHDSGQQPNDPCAICAVMALANSVLFATPPLLLLPQAVEFLYLTTDAEFVHLNSTVLRRRSIRINRNRSV